MLIQAEDEFFTLKEVHDLLALKYCTLSFAELNGSPCYLPYRGFANMVEIDSSVDVGDEPFVKRVFLDGLLCIAGQHAQTLFHRWMADSEFDPNCCEKFEGGEYLSVDGGAFNRYGIPSYIEMEQPFKFYSEEILLPKTTLMKIAEGCGIGVDRTVMQRLRAEVNVCETQSEMMLSQEPEGPTADIPAAKTKNSYLRLIRALSDHAVEGLTEIPTTDANAVLAALKSKQIDAGIKTRALADYLKEAAELNKS
ncbi:hypothetical protein N9137_02355 [Pseudomonadales bacterium]|nr:hypothetical protein [Pseudomonadales bacterium]